MAANRFGAGIGVWFAGNFFTNQLISTGAFEIYYDGQLVSLLYAGTGGGLPTRVGSHASVAAAHKRQVFVAFVRPPALCGYNRPSKAPHIVRSHTHSLNAVALSPHADTHKHTNTQTHAGVFQAAGGSHANSW